MLPDRSNTVLPVSEADETFSWWRPLTPSPPITPKSQSVTALVMTGLRQPITDKEPHIQYPLRVLAMTGVSMFQVMRTIVQTTLEHIETLRR
jgi:hypothetical protein